LPQTGPSAFARRNPDRFFRTRQNPQPTTASILRLQFKGANATPQIAGLEQLPAKVSYYIGNDPTNWHTDVSTYSRVRYHELYPGVDLAFYGNQRRLECDFIVAPGADPELVALHAEGTKGMRITAEGNLLMALAYDAEV